MMMIMKRMMMKIMKKNNLIATLLFVATLVSFLSIDARRGGGRGGGGRRGGGRRGGGGHHRGGRRGGGGARHFRGGRHRGGGRHFRGGGRRRYHRRRGGYGRGYYGGFFYDPWLYDSYWGLGVTVDLTPDRYDYESEITEKEIIERAREARKALEKRIGEMEQYLGTLEKDLMTITIKPKHKKKLVKKHEKIKQDLTRLKNDFREDSGINLERYTRRAHNIDDSIKRLRKSIESYRK